VISTTRRYAEVHEIAYRGVLDFVELGIGFNEAASAFVGVRCVRREVIIPLRSSFTRFR
jgi:hypothetical protein